VASDQAIRRQLWGSRGQEVTHNYQQSFSEVATAVLEDFWILILFFAFSAEVVV
jgi:hypothetical protein